ncbi:MAG: hypothetical protein HYR78_03500 [Nitrospirae bacterium]|nr:hypothetical protein [Nitrospirota bacterium]
MTTLTLCPAFAPALLTASIYMDCSSGLHVPAVHPSQTLFFGTETFAKAPAVLFTVPISSIAMAF